jgi:hypothetical protein
MPRMVSLATRRRRVNAATTTDRTAGCRRGCRHQAVGPVSRLRSGSIHIDDHRERADSTGAFRHCCFPCSRGARIRLLLVVQGIRGGWAVGIDRASARRPEERASPRIGPESRRAAAQLTDSAARSREVPRDGELNRPSPEHRNALSIPASRLRSFGSRDGLPKTAALASPGNLQTELLREVRNDSVHVAAHDRIRVRPDVIRILRSSIGASHLLTGRSPTCTHPCGAVTWRAGREPCERDSLRSCAVSGSLDGVTRAGAALSRTLLRRHGSSR